MWRRKERGGEGGKSSAMDSPFGSGSISKEVDDQWRDEDPNWQHRELHLCGSLHSHRINVNYFLKICQIFYWKLGEKMSLCAFLCVLFFLKGRKQAQK